MRGTGGFAGLRLPRAPSTCRGQCVPAELRNLAPPEAMIGGFAAGRLGEGARDVDRNGEREGFAPRISLFLIAPRFT